MINIVCWHQCEIHEILKEMRITNLKWLLLPQQNKGSHPPGDVTNKNGKLGDFQVWLISFSKGNLTGTASRYFEVHHSESRWLAPPKRWLSNVRGHDKPIHGSCAIYFAGCIYAFDVKAADSHLLTNSLGKKILQRLMTSHTLFLTT